MTREALIRRDFRQDMRLLEVGASTNPVLAKRDGWNTTVVDHANADELRQKYAGLGQAVVQRIEPVDFIWKDGPLEEVIPVAMRGSFDGIVASHVIEHFPDLLAFFNAATALLKPDGIMALAVPDKRACFDYFMPLTMTGDVLAAHLEKRTRHPLRTLYNQAAYEVLRNGQLGWSHADTTSPFTLMRPFAVARQTFEVARQVSHPEYQDSHAWAFTPASFELLMLELNLLQQTDWTISSIQPAASVEFYAWLRRAPVDVAEAEIDNRRFSLLVRIMEEVGGQLSQLGAAADPAPSPAMDLSSQVAQHEARLTALEAVATRLTSLLSPARRLRRALHFSRVGGR